MQLKHIEGKGIGYQRGYTTFQAFFSPSHAAFVPLFDFRGHVFDDGKFAANTGLGFRYQSRWLLGATLFYDYRQTHHFNFNQAALCLEALGSWVDLRLNGYLPIGRKHGAFKGANAEIGFHLFKSDTTAFYSAVGSYYFEAKGKNAIGAKGRLSIAFLDHVRLELSGSYDPVFSWIGQAQVSLMYFWGSESSQCNALQERKSQWIDRQEIIIVD